MTEQAQHRGGTQAGADLTRLWEEHIRHEFVTGSTDDTLDTMVEDAYVDHVPVLTGGSGKAALREFYATHFIPKMPPDMEMVPVSRTIGSHQLVDEMVIKFTHTVEMDWMLPGIPPTDRRVEVASSFDFATGNWPMSTFIGTKRRCSSKSDCSIQRS